METSHNRADMHIALVQKVMKMFKNKPGKAKPTTEVKTRGQYIHKALGSYFSALTIPVIEVGRRYRDPDHRLVMDVGVTDFNMRSLTEANFALL